MPCSMPVEGSCLPASHAACGGKNSTPSPIATEKGRALSALKKFRFSARRAFQMVSRSIEYRGAVRSESDGDVSSQVPGEGSPRSPVAALGLHLSKSSCQLHPALSLRTPKGSVDMCAEFPLVSGDLQPTHLQAQQQPQQHQYQYQPQNQQHQLQQQYPSPHSPTSLVSPAPKPRSLLSALLRRQSTGALASTDPANNTTPNTSINTSTSASTNFHDVKVFPAQPQAPTSSRQQLLQASCPEMIGHGQSASQSQGPCQRQSPPAPPMHACPFPSLASSVGRLCDSLPLQQERRRPVPSPLLVPDRPGHSTAADRVELCLSAPSPHMAQLKQVVMLDDAKRSGGGAAAVSPPPYIAPMEAVAAMSMPAAMVPILRGAGGPQAAAGTSPAQQHAALDVPRMPLVLLGADEAATSPGEPAGACGSVPATSLLASSFCASGGLGGLRQGTQPRLLPPRPPLAMVPPPLAEGSSRLLATSSSTPPSMQRSCWALEDYSLQKRLYKGKMASVYKGRCLRSGMPVALKVYFKSRVPPNVVHMILREVSIHLQASEHRSVLKLYGVFQTDDVVVLVMELAPRGSLAAICQGVGGGRLSEAQVRQTILDPLLDALSYLHGKGVCHRDIKPENLLFTLDWGLRVADFGVSINLTEERAVTRAGTAEYMAPEVERCPLKAHPDENKHDPSLGYSTAADVWSVGVLVYELLVGFPPVVIGSGGGRGGRRAQPSSCLPLSFPASVSPGARDFITAALAQLPEERPTVRQLRCHPWMLAAGAGADAGRRPRDIEL